MQINFNFSINVDDRLVRFGKKIFNRRVGILMLLLLLASGAMLLFSGVNNQLHTFDNGEVISSTLMNQNFELLGNQTDQLTEDVSVLQNTALQEDSTHVTNWDATPIGVAYMKYANLLSNVTLTAGEAATLMDLSSVVPPGTRAVRLLVYYNRTADNFLAYVGNADGVTEDKLYSYGENNFISDHVETTLDENRRCYIEAGQGSAAIYVKLVKYYM